MVARVLLLLSFVFCVGAANAQVFMQSAPSSAIGNSNVLIDGSTGYSVEAGAGPYIGKGIVIPSVDLVNFEFDLTLADGITFPTYFDGMIVYNNATGTTLTTGDRCSTATAVTPGFYYFSNPGGALNGNVTGGEWKALGGSGGGSGSTGVFPIRSATAATTLTTSDYTLLCNATAGGFTVTLPSAAANSGRMFLIRKTDESDNVITFSTSIKSSVSQSFTTLNYLRTIRIQSDGTDWFLMD